MTGCLHIETGGEPRVVPLDRDVVHLGRGLSADVRLDDATVSRRHAVIVRRPSGEVAILDDRSMNGVWVNGERVTDATLNDGDEITLGRVPLLFRAAVPEAAAA